jgi:Flp pilus assembly protein TadG
MIRAPRTRRLVRRILRDRHGIAITEFALVFPIMLLVGMGGIELANYALVHLRVSQYALTLADNASRVGSISNLSVQQLREGDINDVLQGAYLPGQSVKLTTYGRITLSSLENTQSGGVYTQVIHWQRCVGLMSGTGWDSTYGTTSTTAGTTTNASDAGTAAPTGIGDTGYKVNAPQNSGAMFVEINYQYRPIFGSLIIPATKLHYTGAFPVRNNRDFTQIYNPSNSATRSTCDRHVATVPNP